MEDDLLIQGRRGFTLRITADGVSARYVWRTSHFAWRDISGNFRPVWRYVAFDLTPEARGASKLRASYTWLQRKLFGFDAAIDPTPYRLSQSELIRVLDDGRLAHDRAP